MLVTNPVRTCVGLLEKMQVLTSGFLLYERRVPFPSKPRNEDSKKRRKFETERTAGFHSFLSPFSSFMHRAAVASITV